MIRLSVLGASETIRRTPLVIRSLLVATSLTLSVLAALSGPVAAGIDNVCAGKPITIFATGGTTHGTSGNDVIQGSPGDDVIDGRGGNDTICDFSGTNVLNGGSGADVILGSGTIQGGSGNDVLFVRGPGSVADGGAGHDQIEVGEGANAWGGSGNDTIFGMEGSLYGGSGKDTISAGPYVSLVDCGSGYDDYDVFGGGQPTIKGCEAEFDAG